MLRIDQAGAESSNYVTNPLVRFRMFYVVKLDRNSELMSTQYIKNYLEGSKIH